MAELAGFSVRVQKHEDLTFDWAFINLTADIYLCVTTALITQRLIAVFKQRLWT